MRLPKDVNNWTLAHAIAAVKAAREAFDKYERLYSADHQQRTNELYGLYLTAEETARQVITATSSTSLMAELPGCC